MVSFNSESKRSVFPRFFFMISKYSGSRDEKMERLERSKKSRDFCGSMNKLCGKKHDVVGIGSPEYLRWCLLCSCLWRASILETLGGFGSLIIGRDTLLLVR